MKNKKREEIEMKKQKQGRKLIKLNNDTLELVTDTSLLERIAQKDDMLLWVDSLNAGKDGIVFRYDAQSKLWYVARVILDGDTSGDFSYIESIQHACRTLEELWAADETTSATGLGGDWKLESAEACYEALKHYLVNISK